MESRSSTTTSVVGSNNIWASFHLNVEGGRAVHDEGRLRAVHRQRSCRSGRGREWVDPSRKAGKFIEYNGIY